VFIGGKIGFFSGDVRKLIEDFQALKPTVVVGAPRVYQKIYDRVMHAVNHSGRIKKILFKTAYEAKRRAISEGQTTPIWDYLVFNKLKQQIFGGRVEIFVSGSAPLSATVAEFLRICFAPVVVEGYGLTETTAACNFQLREDTQTGIVGPPLPNVEIKLIDVPEMKYTSNDKPYPRGEIAIRGAIVTDGYFKEPEKTKEVFKDGWFLSGDVGRVNADGTVSIIDRKKNIFKIALGEYIAPEYLEAVYHRSSYVAQCFVYGDSYQAQLVGVVVPDEEVLQKWAAAAGIKADFKTLCSKAEVNELILKDLERVGKEAKLNSYELLKAIYLDHVLWTIDDVLTPTMKHKRMDCKQKYQPQINALYEKLNSQETNQ